MGRVITLLVFLVVTAIGGWALSSSFPSDAQVQQESQNAIANYTPICDNKAMRPGDTCMRFGNGAKSQTYEEMVTEYDNNNSPAGVRTHYRARMWLGIVAAGLGGLVVLLVLLSLVGSARRRWTRMAGATATR